jgi:hypothetical protein
MTRPRVASGNAPGWSWRRSSAGRVDQPWPDGLPAHVGGLCQHGWHHNCPQAPLTLAGPGQCACPCHQATQQMHLDLDPR